ncbi:hypothetical protein [Enterobacter kobei]|uniref:hypothetical protein n=1 Tax=Enterobacter kobei TaxID=208224 RepID=UPI0013E933C8|nr:hypothetical protein [Enterobacter kobei]MCA1257585.1 hypothetical protein [Enterobacter kobei]
MFHSETEDIYGFVSGDMSLRPHSIDRDLQDLRLLLADMDTINILNERGIGTQKTIFHVTQNESKALMLVTRLIYCQGGGRFTHPECALLVEQITDLGRKLGNKHFDAAMNEAKRFIANEADFMKEQTVW